MKPQLDIVKYRELFKQTDILEGSGDSFFVNFDCAAACQLFAVEEKVSLGRFVYTCEKVEDCCFAGTVRSDQSVELTFFD